MKTIKIPPPILNMQTVLVDVVCSEMLHNEERCPPRMKTGIIIPLLLSELSLRILRTGPRNGSTPLHKCYI